MKPTRAERRAAVRAEQAKVVPGTGIKTWFDRGAWAVGGGKAGEWNWWPLIGGFAGGMVLVWLVIDRDVIGIIGPVLGIAAVVARGHWLHRRYVSRTGG